MSAGDQEGITEDETRQELALRATQDLGLPCPRLQFTWLPLDDSWDRKECLYTIVLPLRPFDIRAEGENGERVRREHHGRMGLTRATGGGYPVRGGQVDCPFRDGAHATWDAGILGDLPIYAVCETFITRWPAEERRG